MREQPRNEPLQIGWERKLCLENDRIRADRLEKETKAGREKIAALEKLALRDELTQLPNRRAFQEEIKRRHDEVQRSLIPSQEGAGQQLDCSVLAIDLDGFKEVNDRFGHAAGDDCLREVAQRVTQQLRPLDMLARTGGDEFMIVLPNTSAESARLVANRVHEAIRRGVTEEMRERYPSESQDAPELQISASIGIVSFQQEITADGHLPEADELVLRADYASKVVKEAGKDATLSFAGAQAIDDRGEIQANFMKGK